MNTTNKEKQREISKLWALEKSLGIPIWDNYLTLPQQTRNYAKAESELQIQMNCALVEVQQKSDLILLVFLSEKSKLPEIFQFLPFLSANKSCYLCHHQLIEEHLTFLNQNSSLTGDNTATKQLLSLLENAIKRGASDIHLENHQHVKSVRIRVNGLLHQVEMTDRIEEPLFSKIKLISNMDIAKKMSSQDGHFPFTAESGKRFDMRTSTIPAIYGEKIVIRLLPAATIQFSMQELGFSTDQIPVIRKYIIKRSGMILFTGPTGSGKTTSLYAILNELKSESINIVTIEDPVEYRIDQVTQVEVNELAGVSFSSALRAFLRQDPDVILIGEIRDKETAQIAARAAQTGHLVLSTLHSNNAFETIRRLQTLGVTNDDIASSLNLVISQRLVRQRCSCGKNTSCKTCQGTGSRGRIPIMEILELSPSLRHLIAKGHAISDIRRHAEDLNHESLPMVGKKLVQKGQISRKEYDAICCA